MDCDSGRDAAAAAAAAVTTVAGGGGAVGRADELAVPGERPRTACLAIARSCVVDLRADPDVKPRNHTPGTLLENSGTGGPSPDRP